MRTFRSAEGQMVYFAVTRDTGRVKIGLAVNPFQRVATLQTSCWEDVALIGYALVDNPREVEADLHRRFSATHIRGEWFDWSDEIDDYVDRHLSRDWAAIGHLRAEVKRGRNGRRKR